LKQKKIQTEMNQLKLTLTLPLPSFYTKTIN
jgi:hypothetical protein